MKFSSWLSYLLVLVGVAAIARWQVPSVTPPSSTIVHSLLNQLEAECDLTTPGNDYEFYPVPATEARRRHLIQELQAAGPSALPQIRTRLQQTGDQEFREMLDLAAAALGDEAGLARAARLLAWSPSPAVRMEAVRVLRQLRDPRSTEWLQTALQDERFVMNCGCGAPPERYYPIRTVAEIALLEMKVPR